VCILREDCARVVTHWKLGRKSRYLTLKNLTVIRKCVFEATCHGVGFGVEEDELCQSNVFIVSIDWIQ